jgi:hypothetical protein
MIASVKSKRHVERCLNDRFGEKNKRAIESSLDDRIRKE